MRPSHQAPAGGLALPPMRHILPLRAPWEKAHFAGNGFGAMTHTLSGNYEIPEGSSESESSIFFVQREEAPQCSCRQSTERKGDHREIQEHRQNYFKLIAP